MRLNIAQIFLEGLYQHRWKDCSYRVSLGDRWLCSVEYHLFQHVCGVGIRLHQRVSDPVHGLIPTCSAHLQVPGVVAVSGSAPMPRWLSRRVPESRQLAVWVSGWGLWWDLLTYAPHVPHVPWRRKGTWWFGWRLGKGRSSYRPRALRKRQERQAP